MHLVAIGLDIVETSRIASSRERFGVRFLHRVFTQPELDYALAMPRPDLHLAARFAAKEAISKAFGTGIGARFGWRDAWILHAPSGQPLAGLSPAAAALAGSLGANRVLVSLSHTAHYAAAQAALVRA